MYWLSREARNLRHFQQSDIRKRSLEVLTGKCEQLLKRFRIDQRSAWDLTSATSPQSE
jgi:hypothetical protein